MSLRLVPLGGCPPHPGSGRGFTIIEVLVTTVVLGAGLLGLARLQTESLRNTQIAEQRTEAARLAADMADRMRANAQGVADRNYDNNDSTASSGCIASACTPAQIADDDLAEWRTALQARLPGGVDVAGAVCIDSTPNDGAPGAPACDSIGNVYAIKIWWDDLRTGVVSDFRLFVTSLQP